MRAKMVMRSPASFFVVGADDESDHGVDFLWQEGGAFEGVLSDGGDLIGVEGSVFSVEFFEGDHADVVEECGEREGVEVEGVGEGLGGAESFAFLFDVVAQGVADEHAEVEDVGGVLLEVVVAGGGLFEECGVDGVVLEVLEHLVDGVLDGGEGLGGEGGAGAEGGVDFLGGVGDAGADLVCGVGVAGVVLELDVLVEYGVEDLEEQVGEFVPEGVDVVLGDLSAVGEEDGVVAGDIGGEGHAGLELCDGQEYGHRSGILRGLSDGTVRVGGPLFLSSSEWGKLRWRASL